MKFLRYIGLIAIIHSTLYSQGDFFNRLEQLQETYKDLQARFSQMVTSSKGEPRIDLAPGKKPLPSGILLPPQKPTITPGVESAKVPLEPQPLIPALPSIPFSTVSTAGVPRGGMPLTGSSGLPTTGVSGVPGITTGGIGDTPSGTGTGAISGIMPSGVGTPSAPIAPLTLPKKPTVEVAPGLPPPPPPLKPAEAVEVPGPVEAGVPPPPPPPGGGLPPPPPLPPMIGTLGGLPGPKKVLTPLSAEEISAIDQPEQTMSDQLMLKALNTAADPNLKTFKAYRDAWNNLSYQEGFKKRQELQQLLKWIDQTLKKKPGASDADLLAPFVSQQESVPAQAEKLLKAMLFNQQYAIDFATERFVINSVVIQRSPINETTVKDSQKIISDDLVSTSLKKAIALGPNSTVNTIYKIFDRLRVQLTFLRFGAMVATGKEKPKGGDAKSLQEELKQKVGTSEGGPVITQPLLTILNDVAVPLNSEVEQALKSLFFFPGIELADQTVAQMVRALIEDKRKQLAEKGTGKITFEQVTNTLMEAKDLPRLKVILRSYPAVYDLFSSAQLSADLIIDGLAKEFATTVSNPLKRHIHNIIDPFIEQQRVARILAQELAATIKRYDQTREYQDASFYKNISDQLAKDRSVKKIKEFLDYFTSLYRVEFEVWEKLKSLIGTDLLKEYGITDQKVFFLFAPYGMVLQLLSDFVKDGDYDMLMTSLRGLNGEHATSKGLMRPEEPNYGPIIKTHKQRLSSYGLYRNMLVDLIRAFTNYDIITGLANVTFLVKRADLDIENKPEYKQLLEAVRTKVLTLKINTILGQLQALNQNNPSVSIPGLPRAGTTSSVGRDILLRNALIYEELADKLTELIKAIRDNTDTLAAIDTSTLIDKVPWNIMQEHLKEQKGYEQGLQIVRNYMDGIANQINDLQKMAQEPIH